MAFTKTGLGTSLGVVDMPKRDPKKVAEKPISNNKQEQAIKAVPKTNH